MKNLTLWYWIVSLPFLAFMVFSSIPDATLDPKATAFMQEMGYQDYFTRFIGIAKLLGVAVILLPLPIKIKEWAYMGLAFDLIGAFVSVLSVFGFDPGVLMIPAALILLFISYYLLLRKRKAM